MPNMAYRYFTYMKMYKIKIDSCGGTTTKRSCSRRRFSVYPPNSRRKQQQSKSNKYGDRQTMYKHVKTTNTLARLRRCCRRQRDS